MRTPRTSFVNVIASRIAAVAVAATFTSPLLAQNGRPMPQEPESQAPNGKAAEPNAQPPGANGGPVRTRPAPEGKVTLAFNDVPVDEKITAFIAESTGKVVMPVNIAALKAKKITLMNDEPVDRALALDLLLTALRLNGVGIVETPQLVILDLVDNIGPLGEIPVLGPDDDVLARDDPGPIIVKIFRLTKAPAETVADQLTEKLPTYASLTVDVNSNQIVLISDVGFAQRIQKMVDQLDRMGVEVKVETFQLMYADANAVADQIFELFDDSGQAAQRQSQRQNGQQQQRGRQPNQPGQPGQATAAGVTAPGTQVPLRVSVNIQQNSVTVAAEPPKVASIGKLVREEWDLPLPPENSKVYKLQYTDPLQVRDLLQSLLGAGGSSGSSGGRTGAPRGAQAQQFGQQGGGGSVSDVIGDIYRVEAYPDQNAVIVVSKTKESLDYLDSIVKSIDQPSISGLPMVIELKHANAFELADELNVLLAESGTGQGLQRPGSGLTAEDNLSSVSEDPTGTGATDTTGQTGADEGTIDFPWQSAQPRDDRSDPSSLIGKVRIVPIERQNALAILAPIAHQRPVRELIESFDKPGRQVMISAIIAEVELNDELALGIRFSSEQLIPTIPDGSLGVSMSAEGESTDVFSGLFDTSVLNANVDLNVLIQAMRQKTNVRILQEPRVFTADNQEAVFFDGQDVPFATSSNTSDTSGFQQNFEYQAVGVQLDVRPRITAQRDVDMEINLVLSSVVPGQTVGGNFILDRRETTTKVIVKNNQTIVLSGIMTDTESEITRGIPLLEDIPLLGELFRSRDTTKKTTELIAFITPTVVDNPDANDHNFNESARDRLRSLSLPLKEQAKHREAIRERILTPKGENEPIAPTAATELQRLQQVEEQEQRIKQFEKDAKELREQMKKEQEEAKKAEKEGINQPPPPATNPSEEPNAP